MIDYLQNMINRLFPKTAIAKWYPYEFKAGDEIWDEQLVNISKKEAEEWASFLSVLSRYFVSPIIFVNHFKRLLILTVIFLILIFIGLSVIVKLILSSSSLSTVEFLILFMLTSTTINICYFFAKDLGTIEKSINCSSLKISDNVSLPLREIYEVSIVSKTKSIVLCYRDKTCYVYQVDLSKLDRNSRETWKTIINTCLLA